MADTKLEKRTIFWQLPFVAEMHRIGAAIRVFGFG